MKPSYRLIVNGHNITPKINGRLVSLSLTDERGDKADQLDIVLDDSDGRLEIPPSKAEIEVWLGDASALTYKGTFTVDEIQHAGPPDQLTLRARSVDFKGSLKRKREQSYHSTTLGDILTTVAKRNGLEPKLDNALARQAIEHIDQTSESDINLVKRLADRYGALGTIKAGRLLFAPAGTGKTATGNALPTLWVNRNEVSSHHYSRAERDSDYTGVQTYWQNKSTGAQQTVTVGTDDNPKVMRHTYSTAAEAKAAATAEYKKINRAGGKLTLNFAEGRPTLTPETPLSTNGFKAPIDATDWVTSRVVHSLNDSGLLTVGEFEVKHF